MSERDVEEFFIYHGHIHKIPEDKDFKNTPDLKDFLEEKNQE